MLIDPAAQRQLADPAAPRPSPGAPQPAASRHGGFLRLLGALNPLQYLPVIGPLYRAMTGDDIPAAQRIGGSLVVSTLMGGPVGLVIGIAETVGEQAIGLDPDRAERRVLAAIGVGHAPPADVAAPAALAMAPLPHADPGPAAPAHEAAAALGWSKRQLAAYGVHTAADGGLQRGQQQGADVLNGLELARLDAARGLGAEGGALA